jgi:hypothetical protein
MLTKISDEKQTIGEVSYLDEELHDEIRAALVHGQETMVPWTPEIQKEMDIIACGPASIDENYNVSEASIHYNEGSVAELMNSSLPAKVIYSPAPSRRRVSFRYNNIDEFRISDVKKERSSGSSIDDNEFQQIQEAIAMSIKDEERRLSGCSQVTDGSSNESDPELALALALSKLEFDSHLSMEEMDGQKSRRIKGKQRATK